MTTAKRVLVTGATGFIGRALVQRLLGEGHRVTAWVRDPERARNQLGPAVALVGVADGDDALRNALGLSDAVINLAGAGIIDRRWTKARKRELWASRVQLTQRLVRAMAGARAVPQVFLSGSAVGYYGDRAAEPLDEHSAKGEGFLADLCEAWEAAALEAEALGSRVVLLRTGIVLGLDGGALGAMLPAFRAGVGGPLGNGQQFMPWITLDDHVAVMLRGLSDERMRGPINVTAPRPEDGRTFAHALAASLHKPAVISVPALALRALLGERAQAVLQSQRALPRALEQLGHRFEHRVLKPALEAVLAPLEAISIRPARHGGAANDHEVSGARSVLEAETLLDVPIERAFSFFCRAENLGLITPSFMRFEIVGQPPDPVAEGSVIEYRIQLGPVPLRWKTVIQQWSPPSHFVDQQQRGPYALWWHEHILRPEGGRTRMIDRVSYAAPLGPLGKLANHLFIERTLRSIFAYRSEAVHRLFGRAVPA